MRRTRLRLATAVAALGVTAAVTPSQAAPPPALAGVTTLSGSTTGYVRVALTRPARLRDPRLSRDSVLLTGGGRFAAFALVPDAPRGPFLVGGHTDFTRREAAIGGELVGELRGGHRDGDAYLLPAGTYRLYLVPDGKPARLTLRLDGLRGRQDLRPTVARAALVQDGERLHPDDTKVALSFGGERGSGSPMFRFSVAALRVEAHTETSYTNCEYVGRPVGPNPYLPGCPGGLAGSASTLISDEFVEKRTIGSYGFGLYGPGRYASGVAVATGSVVTAADAKQVWVQL